METVPVKPERLAQLEDLARRRGKSTADALDDVLADYLEWERQDYQEAVEGYRNFRCAVAWPPESRDSPVRQLLYGRKPHVYRILFAVDGDLVQVLHVRHARRRPLARP